MSIQFLTPFKHTYSFKDYDSMIAKIMGEIPSISAIASEVHNHKTPYILKSFSLGIEFLNNVARVYFAEYPMSVLFALLQACIF